MIISLCNTNSNRVWNQLRCIKLNWEYMSTSVTYSRLKNLKIFLSLFIKIRKLLLKISTDIPTNISTNISFPAVWNKFPIKKHKQISLFWSKVYIKKSVLKLTSQLVSARVISYKILIPNWWTTALYEHDYNITAQID